MSSFLHERVHVFSPTFIYGSLMSKLKEEYPLWGQDKHLVHDFISWGVKKAFCDITGFNVDGFKEDKLCQDLYNNYKPDFETFMFPFTTKVNRMLWMQLGCSGDEEELVGGRNYIVFSLGVWGDHATIMLALKAALQPLGDMYYLDNDCDGEWEKV